MKVQEMRVTVLRPGDQKPEKRILDGSIKSLKEIARGYVECVIRLPGGWTLIYERNGLLKSLPFNRKKNLGTPGGWNETDIILVADRTDWTEEVVA